MNLTESELTELLRLFQAFSGADRYRKFLLFINTRAIYKNRLLFWQEKLWDEFCINCGEYAHLTQAELLELFRICHIHDQTLEDDCVTAIYGHWRFPDEYLTAREESFPFANMMFCGDSVDRQRHANRHVKFCPACRDALIQWNAGRIDRIGIP